MVKQDVLLYDSGNELEEQGEIVVNILGAKRYEITNYLGNVNAVITDRKVYASPGALTVYEAVVMLKADYYPFGMTMPGRHESGEGYRFGYNGMEINPEVSGDGNSYTTEFRQYDPRLGRWLSLDPLMAMFPWMSPYVAFDNNPVFFVDPLGLAAEGGPGGPGGPPPPPATTLPPNSRVKDLPEVYASPSIYTLTVKVFKPEEPGVFQKLGLWLSGLEKLFKGRATMPFGVELKTKDGKQVGQGSDLPQVKPKNWKFVWTIENMDEIMDLVGTLDNANKLNDFSNELRKFRFHIKGFNTKPLSRRAFYKKHNLTGNGKKI